MTRIVLLALLVAFGTGCGSDCPECEDTGGGGDTGPDWVDADGDGVIAGVDCDDGNAAVYPGAADGCDGVDNDCDGVSDEDGIGGAMYYADDDDDGFGDIADPVLACEAPEGYVADNTDCDDRDFSVYPGAEEVCNNTDDDCDGSVDDGASDSTPWFADVDGDGYGDVEDLVVSCNRVDGYVRYPTDCDDTDATVNPSADEVCDGIDQDCDGIVDDNSVDAPTWYADLDDDGYGNPEWTEEACEVPEGYLEDATDCDDLDPEVYPDATEWCDGEDDDCDGEVDEADAADASTWYADGDGDGYGDPDATAPGCSAPSGYLADSSDCDDSDATVNPEGTEVCEDGVDNDCDGTAGGCRLSGTEAASDADVTWTGTSSSDYFGQAADFAGDLDGDGYGDVLVGAYGSDAGGSNAGAAYVLYGSSTLSGSYAGSSGAVLTGGAASDNLGFAVAGAGDVNGDGYDDLLLGAYGEDTGGSTAGAVYLFYGSATRLSGTASATTADATFTGESANSYLGHGVAAAGDVDDDGYDDLLMGAYYTSTYAGTVYLVYGDATGLSGSESLSDAPRWTGDAASDYLGYRWGLGSGDFDGDGHSDLAMGAYGYDGDTDTLGAVYVTMGWGTRFTGSTSASDADTVITGTTPGTGGAAFGYALADGGDVNGDGYQELLVGAYYYDDPASDAGAGYVFLGAYGGWASTLSASDADVTITGEAAYDYMGRDVGNAGDLDDDGYDEVAFGASGADDPASSAGAVAVVYGSSSPSGTLACTDADFVATGSAASDYVGYGIGSGGDLDGDGYADLLVGQYGTTSSAGAAVLFYGTGI